MYGRLRRAQVLTLPDEHMAPMTNYLAYNANHVSFFLVLTLHTSRGPPSGSYPNHNVHASGLPVSALVLRSMHPNIFYLLAFQLSLFFPAFF